MISAISRLYSLPQSLSRHPSVIDPSPQSAPTDFAQPSGDLDISDTSSVLRSLRIEDLADRARMSTAKKRRVNMGTSSLIPAPPPLQGLLDFLPSSQRRRHQRRSGRGKSLRNKYAPLCSAESSPGKLSRAEPGVSRAEPGLSERRARQNRRPLLSGQRRPSRLSSSSQSSNSTAQVSSRRSRLNRVNVSTWAANHLNDPSQTRGRVRQMYHDDVSAVAAQSAPPLPPPPPELLYTPDQNLGEAHAHEGPSGDSPEFNAIRQDGRTKKQGEVSNKDYDYYYYYCYY